MQIEHSSQFVRARQPHQVVVYLMQNLRLRGRPHQSFSPINALLVLIELFSLGVTVEALRAQTYRKIGDFAPTRSL